MIALMSHVADLLNFLMSGPAADIEMSQEWGIPGQTDKAGNKQSQI